MEAVEVASQRQAEQSLGLPVITASAKERGKINPNSLAALLH